MVEIAVGVGLCLLFIGSAAIGYTVRTRIPKERLTSEAIDLIQIVLGLLVTFTALVLSLLTSSVKADYDKAQHDRVQYAAELTQLDRCMRNYGPGSEHVREQLQQYVAAVIASTWPDEPHPVGIDYPDTSKMATTGAVPVLADLMNSVGVEIAKLDPSDNFHRKLADLCLDTYKDVQTTRWSVIEDVYNGLSLPFYGVVVFWTAIVFGGFGLRAPRNTMVALVVALGAISATSALQIVYDLSTPYSGLFRIESTSMRTALAAMRVH